MSAGATPKPLPVIVTVYAFASPLNATSVIFGTLGAARAGAAAIRPRPQRRRKRLDICGLHVKCSGILARFVSSLGNFHENVFARGAGAARFRVVRAGAGHRPRGLRQWRTGGERKLRIWRRLGGDLPAGRERAERL